MLLVDHHPTAPGPTSSFLSAWFLALVVIQPETATPCCINPVYSESTCNHRYDGVLDVVRIISAANVSQHHAAGEEERCRVGLVLARKVRCSTVHRLRQR